MMISCLSPGAGAWCALFDSGTLLGAAACSQRCWDDAAFIQGKPALMNHTSGPIDKGILLAVSAPHAGDWLMAMPISSCGQRGGPCGCGFVTWLQVVL